MNSSFQNSNEYQLLINFMVQPRFHAEPNGRFFSIPCLKSSAPITKLPTTFIVFLRSSSTPLDWSAKVSRKFPREYNCSQIIEAMATTAEVVRAFQLSSVLRNDFIISIFCFNLSKNTLSKYFNDFYIEHNQIHKYYGRKWNDRHKKIEQILLFILREIR